MVHILVGMGIISFNRPVSCTAGCMVECESVFSPSLPAVLVTAGVDAVVP